MSERRQILRRVAAILFFALILATVLSFFIAPQIRDARIRAALGIPDARVTDTARSPYLYINESGEATLYPDGCGDMTELVLPEAINGITVKTFFVHGLEKPSRIKTLVLPRTFEAGSRNFTAEGWQSLETVIVPDGVKDISYMRFKDNPCLAAVYIPRSVTSVYSIMLKDQPELTVIHYAGTEEEWRALGWAAAHIADTRQIVYGSVAP